MATNYEKGFIIEYDPTIRKRVSCKDCICYNKEDLSCSAGKYLPEDGYNSWKTCAKFEFNRKTYNAEEKYNKLPGNKKVSTNAEPYTNKNGIFNLPLSPLVYVSENRMEFEESIEMAKEYFKTHGKLSLSWKGILTNNIDGIFNDIITNCLL